jgi:hypothetical protein
VLAGLAFRFRDYAETRTVPRTSERDQTADRVVVLEEVDRPGRLWLGLMEFQSEHDPGKLDDLFVEAGQFRRNLRHGADRAGKYDVLPILVYLRGTCPEAEAVLDMTVPAKLGIRHAPAIWEVGKDKADEALEAFEQGKTTWGILFWIVLMKGAEDPPLVARWLALVEKVPVAGHIRADMKGIALVFAGPAGRGQVWRRILEGWTMTESPIVNEWMEATKMETLREALIRVVQRRFPGAVSPETVALIRSQPSLAMLNDWIDQAAVARTVEEFDAYLRR